MFFRILRISKIPYLGSLVSDAGSEHRAVTNHACEVIGAGWSMLAFPARVCPKTLGKVKGSGTVPEGRPGQPSEGGSSRPGTSAGVAVPRRDLRLWPERPPYFDAQCGHRGGLGCARLSRPPFQRTWRKRRALRVPNGSDRQFGVGSHSPGPTPTLPACSSSSSTPSTTATSGPPPGKIRTAATTIPGLSESPG